MYENEESSEKKHPLRLAVAVIGALAMNVAIGSAMMHSGFDDRSPQGTSLSTPIVQDLARASAGTSHACGSVAVAGA